MEDLLQKGMTAKQSSLVMAMSALVLTCLGALMIYSTTLVRAEQLTRSRLDDLAPRQLIWLVAAVIIGFVVSRIDYHRILDNAKWILMIVWLGLALTLVFGGTLNGSRRWLNLGPFGIQSSEFAKLAIVLCCARYAVVRAHVLERYRLGFFPAAIWMGITVGLVAMGPDFGTSLFLITLGFMVLFLGGLPFRHILFSALLALPLFLMVMITNLNHVKRRLASYFADEPMDQVRSSMNLFSSGGLTGTGLGKGDAQHFFLPYVESDFIFSAVGEQFGLIGSCAVALLFLSWLWHGIKISCLARDRAGFLVCFGLTFMVVLQAGINMAVVTGLVPPKGIGLPFVSYGGTSLLVLGVAIGMIANIAGQAEPVIARKDQCEDRLDTAVSY